MTTGEEPSDYLTSVLGNATIDWMKSVRFFYSIQSCVYRIHFEDVVMLRSLCWMQVLERDSPLFAYVAPHAPHVPATPAPVQYSIYRPRPTTVRQAATRPNPR